MPKTDWRDEKVNEFTARKAERDERVRKGTERRNAELLAAAEALPRAKLPGRQAAAE